MGKFFNDSKEELIRVYYIKEKGRWAKVAWNGGLLQVKVKTPAHKLEYLNWKSNPKGLSSSLPYDGFSNRGRGVCCIVCIISFPRRKKNKITLRKRKENQLLLPISLSLSLLFRSTLSTFLTTFFFLSEHSKSVSLVLSLIHIKMVSFSNRWIIIDRGLKESLQHIEYKVWRFCSFHA